MAEQMTLGSIITTLFAVMLLAILSLVVFAQYPASYNAANGIRSINQTDQTLLTTGSSNSIGGKLNSTTYSSSGLGASIINTLGFAFVFPAIYQFASTLALLPTLFMTDLNALLTTTQLLGLSGVTTVSITGIVVSYFGMFLIVLWVSGWQKKNFWSDTY
jgi:hypothetical protein